MTFFRNRMLVIAAFALAAVCASATPATAQGIYKGSFTLRHEVRWQNATLPAGDYTFEMKSLDISSPIKLNGPKGSQFIPALVADEKVNEQSMLVLETRGSVSAVTELRLSGIGRTLRYAAPKAPKDVELAQGPVTREQVLVAMKAR
jgi:hypothetical protein